MTDRSRSGPRRALRDHPASDAARTEATALARERHEALRLAFLADEPGEAGPEVAAGREAIERATDEVGNPRAVLAAVEFGEEVREVGVDDTGQDGAGRSATDGGAL